MVVKFSGAHGHPGLAFTPTRRLRLTSARAQPSMFLRKPGADEADKALTLRRVPSRIEPVEIHNAAALASEELGINSLDCPSRSPDQQTRIDAACQVLIELSALAEPSSDHLLGASLRHPYQRLKNAIDRVASGMSGGSRKVELIQAIAALIQLQVIDIHRYRCYGAPLLHRLLSWMQLDYFNSDPQSQHALRSLVRDLLARGADVEARDDHGRTAIFAAVFSGDPNTVRLLLSHQPAPDLSVRLPDGTSLIEWADRNPLPRHGEIVQVLSRHHGGDAERPSS